MNNAKLNHNSRCTSIGVPREHQMYTADAHRSGRRLEKAIAASNTPPASPSADAMTVNVNVTPMPDIIALAVTNRAKTSHFEVLVRAHRR